MPIFKVYVEVTELVMVPISAPTAEEAVEAARKLDQSYIEVAWSTGETTIEDITCEGECIEDEYNLKNISGFVFLDCNGKVLTIGEDGLPVEKGEGNGK